MICKNNIYVGTSSFPYDIFLWVLLRIRERHYSSINEVCEVARKFDISFYILNVFDQTNCNHSKNLAENWLKINAPLIVRIAIGEILLIGDELDGMYLNI